MTDSDPEEATAADVDDEELAVSSTYKVLGELSDPSGVGVRGHNTASSGAAVGVEGVANADGDVSNGVHPAGVAGRTTGSGVTYGVYGRGASSAGWGVVGDATKAGDASPESGDTPVGVAGFTDRSGADPGVAVAIGVGGAHTASSGTGYGTFGRATSPDGYGLFGTNFAGSDSPVAVRGTVPNASGGYGLSTPDDAKVAGTAELGAAVVRQPGGTAGTDEVQLSHDGTDGLINAASGGLKLQEGGTTILSTTGSGNVSVDDNAIQSSSGNGLTFNVDGGTRALTIGVPSNGNAGNFVAGHPNNAVKENSVGAVICGGGANSGGENVVLDNYGVVCGGKNNQAGRDDSSNTGGTYVFVGGGINNIASGYSSVVCGGVNNDATDYESGIVAGDNNQATGWKTFIGGGNDNEASGRLATVTGGDNNTASGDNATVPGGDNNTASGQNSFAAGREAKTKTSGGTSHDGTFVWGDSSSTTVRSQATDEVRFQAGGGFAIEAGGLTVKGGNVDLSGNNLTDGSGGVTINTGGSNRALDLGVPTSDGTNTAGGNVVAGHPNNAVNDSAVGVVISGGGSDGSGRENVVYDDYCTIGGGEANQAGQSGTQATEPKYSTVGGGENNEASGRASTVAGGQNNTASGSRATVAGGQDNTASGDSATVAGGRDNTASGNISFAVGLKADTNNNNGAMVFADGSSTSVTASNAGEVRFQHTQFFIGEGNGITAGSDNNVNIDSSTGELLDASASSARYKTNIEPLSTDTSGVLDLEPRTFDYTESDTSGVGFIAEEADDVFPELVLYDDEGRPDGFKYNRLPVYLLPEIRAHRDRIDDLEAETESLREKNDRLRDENDDLRAENEALRERVAAIEDQLGLDATAGQQGVADD